jgi:FAD/FMN-containing dehydrogenase
MVVAVRGGGHSVAGHSVCDDGLVIDLSPMKSIEVDPRLRRADAAAGVLWGELDRKTQALGLATTGGVVTHTGIAGLTLGGGIGWLMRKHGASVDNLLAAQLVTADGQTVTADANENADLFWAIRGGGGNFGIVTTFRYRLHRVGPQVLAGPIFYALEDSPEVLRFYRDFVADAPDELTTLFNLRRAPPLPALPPEIHGCPVLMIGICYSGPIEQGERAVRPLRELGSPLVDAVGAMPYTTLQALFDPAVPHGYHYHWKTAELPPLTDDAIEILVEHAARQTSPLSYCITFQLGGAMSRVPEQAMAFSQRDDSHNVNITSVWTADDPDPNRHIDWARRFSDALTPLSHERVYVNFLGNEVTDRVRSAYGEPNYHRLATIKASWDPTNFLRGNHNITPLSA